MTTDMRKGARVTLPLQPTNSHETLPPRNPAEHYPPDRLGHSVLNYGICLQAMTTLQTIPTPLTDAACWRENDMKASEVVLADFSRKLERALNLAKAGLKHVTEHYAEESPDRIAEDALQEIEELLKP